MDVDVRKTNLIAEVAKWKKSYDSVPMQHRPDMAILALAECSPKTFQHSAKVQLVVFLAKDPSVAEGLATTPRDCRLSDHSCRPCADRESFPPRTESVVSCVSVENVHVRIKDTFIVHMELETLSFCLYSDS